jgi:tRNA-binding EMAP/Myf-like protein
VPEDLVGKQLPFVTNIAPRKMGALGESNGMLVAASGIVDEEEVISLLEPSIRLPDGSEVR